ncbi:MAG: alpha/beta fold hydrolase [Burkholderiales bacterium]
MPRISIGDCSLYYEEHGSGAPLLMVPGLGGTFAGFAKVIPGLAKHYRVIVHDHRGCGQSDKPLMTYSVDQMANDVIRLMDVLKIDNAHYLGHSTGGAMGQTIAIEHPARVRKLILSATWTHNDAHFSRSFEARRALLQHLGPAGYVRGSNPGLLPGWWSTENEALLAEQEAKQIASFPPVEVMLSRIDAIMRFDRRSELAKIRAATMAIVAAEDCLTPPYFSEAIAKAIPGAVLKVMPRGGHFLYQVDPQPYEDAVLAFLRS